MTPRTKPRDGGAAASACACRDGGEGSAVRSRSRVSSPALLGRCAAGLRWFVPAALLALMPKCPICLAGYVALFTGIGLSFTAASCLRFGLIALCAAALGWFAVQEIRAWLGRRRRAA